MNSSIQYCLYLCPESIIICLIYKWYKTRPTTWYVRDFEKLSSRLIVFSEHIVFGGLGTISPIQSTTLHLHGMHQVLRTLEWTDLVFYTDGLDELIYIRLPFYRTGDYTSILYMCYLFGSYWGILSILNEVELIGNINRKNRKLLAPEPNVIHRRNF